ncbi:MAG: hypothetical protein BGO21_25885 [Dyadobacter sp. 50-39]|uniref:hypothetical protein n=1 Tax=Dyadobacter sp. 50-39 TaxID=1895756 RepID=UPI0009673436|nr:hypothetical protein [Dyadobacter sp. 50-39]OJV17321.1 MAG: hypothetical protein BGO21_25885 [Dyadobacter sp. 50-39]
MDTEKIWHRHNLFWKYVWYRRFITLRPNIKVFFLVGLILVLTYEFMGGVVKSHFPSSEPVINLISKLSYSLIAAIFLYYFNIHWPNEEKKIKTILYVWNRVYQIQSEAHSMLRMLNIEDRPLQRKTYDDLKVEIQSVCDHLQDNTEIQDSDFVRYPNWNVFFKKKGQYISQLVNELLVFESLINSSVLESIVYIENDINTYKLGLRDEIIPRGEIKQYARFIADLYRNAEHAATITRQKLKLYELEHHEIYRKRNERLEKERENFRASIRIEHQKRIDNGTIDAASVT